MKRAKGSPGIPLSSRRLVLALAAVLAGCTGALAASPAPSAAPGSAAATPPASAPAGSYGFAAGQAVAAFKVTAPPQEYTPKTLSRYVDGAAEGFLEKGFVSLTVVEVVRAVGKGDAILEIYRMGNPAGALEVLSSDGNPAAAATLGADVKAVEGETTLSLARGAFYVRIAASARPADGVETLRSLGRAVLARLGP